MWQAQWRFVGRVGYEGKWYGSKRWRISFELAADQARKILVAAQLNGELTEVRVMPAGKQYIPGTYWRE